jgi:hypothetical protein
MAMTETRLTPNQAAAVLGSPDGNHRHRHIRSFPAISRDGIMWYSKALPEPAKGIPANTQKNVGPTFFIAFIPTLQVLFSRVMTAE